MSGTREGVALKWPNDLLVDGAKASGILVEGASLPGGALAVVIGIGVNVRHAPQGTPYPATALAARVPSLTPDAFFAALATPWRDAGDLGRGPRLRGRPCGLARAGRGPRRPCHRAPALRRSLAGVFRDLDPDGRLLLDVDGRTVPIEAGDVFFTPPPRG